MSDAGLGDLIYTDELRPLRVNLGIPETFAKIPRGRPALSHGASFWGTFSPVMETSTFTERDHLYNATIPGLE